LSFTNALPLSLSLSLSLNSGGVSEAVSLCCVSALKATSLMAFLVCPHSYVPPSASAPFSTSLNRLFPQATQATTKANTSITYCISNISNEM